MVIDFLSFVWLGSLVPDYAIKSLKIAKKNNPLKRIILITDQNITNNEDFEVFWIDPYFLKNTGDSSDFWVVTTQRFYAIKIFMEKNNLKNLFHAELDNLIYKIPDISKIINNFDKNLMYVPMDYSGRFIFSFGIISFKALNDFLSFIEKKINFNLNDMELLTRYYTMGGLIKELKSDPLNYKYHTNYRFDAASVGQYLFGTHKNKNINYINPRSFSLKYSKIKFNLNECEIENAEKNYNYLNLHIHSKKFDFEKV